MWFRAWSGVHWRRLQATWLGDGHPLALCLSPWRTSHSSRAKGVRTIVNPPHWGNWIRYLSPLFSFAVNAWVSPFSCHIPVAAEQGVPFVPTRLQGVQELKVDSVYSARWKISLLAEKGFHAFGGTTNSLYDQPCPQRLQNFIIGLSQWSYRKFP